MLHYIVDWRAVVPHDQSVLEVVYLINFDGVHSQLLLGGRLLLIQIDLPFSNLIGVNVFHLVVERAHILTLVHQRQ